MKVASNIVKLYAYQASIYIVPLLTTPYLSRILGLEKFGDLGIATSIVAYMSLIVDWGFNYTATQEAARNAQDPDRLRTLFWDVFTAKVMLGVLSTLVLVGLMICWPSLRAMWPVVAANYLALLSTIFTANWLLQGLERMGVFATVSLAGRLLSLPLTFLLVHEPADVVAASAIQGGTLAFSAIGSMYMASRVLPLLPARWSLKGALHEIGSGWKLFVSTGAISLYTQSNIVILGFVSGSAQAGLFNGAERIRRAVQGLTGPISAAMYPRINNMMVNDRSRVASTMMRMLAAQAALTFLFSLAMFVIAPFGTVAFLGKEYAGAVPVVQWLAATPFLVGVSNVLGINMMLPMGMKSLFSSILLGSGLLNLALLFWLSRHYGAVGAAASVVITETVVVLAMAISLFIRRGELNSLADPVPTAVQQGSDL